MEKTIKELQQVAKHNGFYLCPESVWDEMTKTLMYKDSEIKRLKKARDKYKIKLDALKTKEVNNG